MVSRRGRRCEECSDRGYLVRTDDLSGVKCVCYSSLLDARTGCQPTLLTGTLSETREVNVTFHQKRCVSYQDEIYGCFKETPNGKYGDPNPPVPTQCCTEIYGPPPGELTESLLGEVLVYETCNQFGGIDPSEVNGTGWRLCNGHGEWLANRTCQCSQGWRLDYLGEDILGNEVESCLKCDRYWGPENYCNVIWTPDPLTGIGAECGGRGTFIENGCSCYGNSTIGYWDLLTIDTGIQTCAKCADGFSLPYCR